MIFTPSTSVSLRVGGDRVFGAALGVLDDDLQSAPVDSARGVDLVRGHLLGLNSDRAVGLTWTGDRFHHPDHERRQVRGNGGRLRLRRRGRLLVSATSQHRQRQDRQRAEGKNPHGQRPHGNPVRVR